MDNRRNQTIYKLWAPVYDKVMGPFAGKARRHAIELLNLHTGESVLLSGVGTGLDLPHIQAGVKVTGIDLSPAMLRKAKDKAKGRDVSLLEMNAQALEFPDGSFDAVILNLILSIVTDGAAAFREAWRVLHSMDGPWSLTSSLLKMVRFLRCGAASARSFRCLALIPIGA